jgi:hypothetical protein
VEAEGKVVNVTVGLSETVVAEDAADIPLQPLALV